MSDALFVSLAPRPGFCVKSAALEPGVYTSETDSIPVPAGLKTFVNVAYDPNVPPPAHDALEAAMMNIRLRDSPAGDGNDGTPIPVVVSSGRAVADKGTYPRPSSLAVRQNEL
jgi:hypothetical protein